MFGKETKSLLDVKYLVMFVLERKDLKILKCRFQCLKRQQVASSQNTHNEINNNNTRNICYLYEAFHPSSSKGILQTN